MNQDQLLSILRSLLKLVGTWLLARGYADSSAVEGILGAAPVLAGVVWSWFHHKDENKPSGTAMVWLIAFVPLLMVGCASQGVPTTLVKFNPTTGALSVSSPKQVTSKNFRAVIAKDGSAEVSWDDLSATNSPDVVQTAGDADAKRIAATAGLVHEIGVTVGSAAGAAAKAAAGAP